MIYLAAYLAVSIVGTALCWSIPATIAKHRVRVFTAAPCRRKIGTVRIDTGHHTMRAVWVGPLFATVTRK